MKKIKWRVVKVYGDYFIKKQIVENMALIHLNENNKPYHTKYKSEAKEIADKLNEEEK